jgi:hypothetical protein
MSLFEGKTPAERNKLIAAMALGAIALLSLGYMLFGGSSSKPGVANQNSKRTTTTATTTSQTASLNNGPVTAAQVREDPLTPPSPVPIEWTLPAVPEAGRNIFSFYVPPPTPPKPSPTPPPPPSPSPIPPPPLLVTTISPVNVFARTGDFTLEVTGDKFTPAARILVNGTELPTHFISPQQLSATVLAGMIAGEGPRQITVRTPDGKLFSNNATLNVQAPPTPNYLYIGIIGGKRYNDTAVLKDKSSKELLNVQRGDVVGGRFRVSSISEREVSLVDTSIRVKHTLPFTGDGGDAGAGRNGGPQPRYTPPPRPPDEVEEEP